MKSVYIYFLMIAVTWIQTGCMISKPRYPENWPKPLIDQSPQSFNGIYASPILKIIDQYYSQTSKDSLIPSKVALSITPEFKFQVDSIFNLSPSNDTLLHKLYPRYFPNRKTSIKLNKSGIYIVYREKSSAQAGNPLVGFTKTFNLISKLEDGSLLVKECNWAFGLVFMFLPFYLNEQIWYKIDDNSISILQKK